MTTRFALAASLALAACGKPTVSGGYDASRDAAADIAAAVPKARTEHKRILIEVGGNKCSRCASLRRFYLDNPDLAALRDKNFILLSVYAEAGAPVPVGGKTKYPPPASFPHLYVLDENGTMIVSQAPTELEKKDVYDREKIEFFLKAFGPPKH